MRLIARRANVLALETPGVLPDHGNVVATERGEQLAVVGGLTWVGDGYRTRDLLSHSQAFYH
jgi:hypothetical protein